VLLFPQWWWVWGTRGHLAYMVGTCANSGRGRSEACWAFSTMCEPCSEGLHKNACAKGSGHVRCGRRGCVGDRGNLGKLGDENGVLEMGGTQQIYVWDRWKSHEGGL
jgi:hypothetical protein